MRNAETVLNIIREDSRTVCNWRAVCDESRKHGSEGGLKEKCLRVTRRQPTLHPPIALEAHASGIKSSWSLQDKSSQAGAWGAT
jgi:hypothetical protein